MNIHNELNEFQVANRLNFIDDYIKAINPASGSERDSNANVTQKTVATMEAELWKPYAININRAKVFDVLNAEFGTDVAYQYINDIETHRIYVHDETSLKPYCASVTLYPFLLEGTKCMGGVSSRPTNLQSFCGSFVNLVYQLASNFAGAVATVEFLHMFDYFARKQYGSEYITTNKKQIYQELQGVVYALNQPASARNDQSVFWNISVFDRPYMESMFGEFYYPDGTQVDFESTMRLQKEFMKWFRFERKKELLTYPVLTACLLTKDNGFIDYDFAEYCADSMSKGLSFFYYMSDSVDSLASCCRLRNELADNTFSYTLGAGGVVTGSAQVITLNFNRFVQDIYADMLVETDFKKDFLESNDGVDEVLEVVGKRLREKLKYIHEYLLATRMVYKEYVNAKLLPAYTAGFMDLDKQFLTIGINGVVEAAEFMGYDIDNNHFYKEFLQYFLNIFKEENTKAYKEYGVRFNTEFVPAESLGVKNAKWDKRDGYTVNRDCYNSYFYVVEDNGISVLDKIQLYSKDVTQYLDGGSALHLNLDSLPTKEALLKLMSACAEAGVSYWTTNVLCTICDECNTITAETLAKCPHCGNTELDYGTRVIGYLKRISNFSKDRQEEAERRYYNILH